MIEGKDAALFSNPVVEWSGKGLVKLPPGVGGLSHVVKMNLANNMLSELPAEFLELAPHLRVLFFLNNQFAHIPSLLGRFRSLFMLSFKSNHITHIAEDCLSPSIGWLILTDNRIPALPASFSTLCNIRKLMLATNHLESLPDLSLFSQLELARFSDNRLRAVHASVFNLPKLSWLALGGNEPLSLSPALPPCSVPEVSIDEVKFGRTLGYATHAHCTCFLSCSNPFPITR